MDRTAGGFVNPVPLRCIDGRQAVLRLAGSSSEEATSQGVWRCGLVSKPKRKRVATTRGDAEKM
ncbi:MAG: hypothetical protein QOH34_1808 [Mycobacterium sp.]|nr:hypothetical protein [Mycobacterium sp.]